MGGGLPGPLVGLHDVELGAVVTADLVAVTVVHAVLGGIVSAVSFLAGHGDKVESGNAATVASAQVDVIFDGATKEVRGVVLSRVKRSRPRKVATGVVWDVNHVAA